MRYIEFNRDISTTAMPKLLACLLLSVPLLAAISQANAGKLYKWVDEDGTTYYSDKVPPTDIKREHSRLNETGVTVDVKGAARTEEEIQQEKEKERLRAAQQKQIEEQRARDMVLLKTFRSEDDIVLARDGKLATYDAQIRITHQNIGRLKNRLQIQQQQAADMERQGKKPSAKLAEGINNTQQEIRNNYASILRREKDKELITGKYDADLLRFLELKKLYNDQSIQAQQGGDHLAKYAALVDSAVPCTDESSCDEIWKKAREYGKKHATTSLQVDAERIYMTSPPVTAEDISITVSRIRTSKDAPEVVFLDVQCKKHLVRENSCNTPTAKQIRDGFKAAVH